MLRLALAPDVKDPEKLIAKMREANFIKINFAMGDPTLWGGDEDPYVCWKWGTRSCCLGGETLQPVTCTENSHDQHGLQKQYKKKTQMFLQKSSRANRSTSNQISSVHFPFKEHAAVKNLLPEG